MGVTIGNPIVITSGTLGAEIRGEYFVDRAYWYQPAVAATSPLLITKAVSGGITYLKMQVETSGESQSMDFKNQVWRDPFAVYVPTGTLYIYTR